MFSLITIIKNSLEKYMKNDKLLDWYYLLVLGRLLDQKAPNYLKQALGWSYHAPYAGHDGIQLALGQIFQKNKDHLFPYYRDLLTVLSAGLTPLEILLNGLSKKNDVASGGRHMSNHFAKPEWNIHNTSSCTGNHALHAVGLARAIKTYSSDSVVFCSQGESSLSEGYCYEAINGADREELPVVFVIQDNGYGISVPKKEQTAQEFASDNFSGFKNLKIFHCNGKDPEDSFNTLLKAKEQAKKGPSLVHAHCVRIENHSNSDNHHLYRDEKELQEVKLQDPLLSFKKKLLLRIPESTLTDIEEQAKKILQQAHKDVLKESDPEPESIYDFILPTPYLAKEVQSTGLEQSKFIDAINTTLKEEFMHNPHTYLWGQDVASKDKGGIFNVTKGLQSLFGPKRIFNAPIAEDFILGTANGFSRYSKDIRIVVEGAEFADYFWPAMEQMIECSHDYWRTNGKFSPNITVRLASGGYIGGGLYHSQNIEASLSPIPGIRIVVPAFADDAAGLLRTCIRSEGVSFFLEPKALYQSKESMHFIPKNFEVPFGKSRIRKQGTDLTLISYGNALHLCLKVAQEYTDLNIEVLDLRSLAPLDEEGILESVKKTSRAIMVHEDKVFGGFGGEVVSLIMEKAFDYLDAPVLRVGSEFTPVGFSRILEAATLPSEIKIKKAIENIVRNY